MIGLRSAGAFVAALVGVVSGAFGTRETRRTVPSAGGRGKYTVSAFRGQYGGTARLRRQTRTNGLGLAQAAGVSLSPRAVRTALEKVRRDVSYDKHRGCRRPATRTSTGLLAR